MNARRLSQKWALGCLAVLIGALGVTSRAHAATSVACKSSAVTLSIPTPITISSSVQNGPIGSAGQAQVLITCQKSALDGSPSNTTIQANISAITSVLNSNQAFFASGINGISVELTAVSPASNGQPVPPSGSIDSPGLGNGTRALVTVFNPSNSSSVSVTLTFNAQLYVTGTVTGGGTTTLTRLITSFENYTFGSTDSSTTYGSLNLNKVVVNRSSCQGSSPTVALPPVLTSALSTAGATAGTTPFSLSITGCPTGTQLAISFSSVQDGSATTVAQSTGSASNVGVQMLNSARTPVDITGTQTTNLGTVSSGGNLSVPYYAQYYATGQAGIGTVSAAVTYTLTYP